MLDVLSSLITEATIRYVRIGGPISYVLAGTVADVSGVDPRKLLLTQKYNPGQLNSPFHFDKIQKAFYFTNGAMTVPLHM